jgi:inner membrane protein
MTGRTHDMAAFTALAYVALTHPLPEISLATGITAIFANLIGGIAPDIDQPTAPLWRNLPVGRIFGKVFQAVSGGHRFFSHSLVGIVVFGFAFHFLLIVLHPSFPHLAMPIIWWAFMIGFISHLVMDTFTREGVPWLLPIPIKFGFPPQKVFRVVTGGFIERFIVFPILLLVTVYLSFSHQSTIMTILHQQIK